MAQMKVNIKKVGKRITWHGMMISTPAKFFIDSKDKTRFEITMKQNGIKKSEYTLSTVKNPNKAVVDANQKAKQQAEKSAKNVSEKAKEEVAKVEAKKEEPKKEEPKKAPAPVAPKKEEPKKEEPKKEDSKKDDHKKK